MERAFPKLPADRVAELKGDIERLAQELRKVSDNTRELCVYLASYLDEEIIPIIDYSLRAEVWLLSPSLLDDCAGRLMTTRIAVSVSHNVALSVLLASVALSLLGLVSGLGTPMALASIALAIVSDSMPQLVAELQQPRQLESGSQEDPD